MGDRTNLNTTVSTVYYTKEIAISRFKYITKFCEKKEIPANVSISYSVHAKWYKIEVRVNEMFKEDIKELVYALEIH